MATVKEIYDFLDGKAPFCYQFSWDNAGFLVGRNDQEVKRILVALDITETVIQEAVEKHCDLIAAHHPIIWDKIGAVTNESTTGEKVIRLIENRIAAICAHTNLDSVEGGVNTVLAERVGLLHPVVLETEGTDENGVPYGIGRVGELAEEMSPRDFAAHLHAVLDLPGLRFLDCGHPVRKVAVGGGSCGSMLAAVKEMGCDTFVTSDLKHDMWIDARQMGINLLDAGHYSTETVVCPVMAEWLREGFPGVEVEISERQGEDFEYFPLVK